MVNASEKRILVVDDEPDVRNYIAACLEDAGFQVEIAVDGLDALDKVDKISPDLMTLDMVMPGKSGIHVIRTLRKNEKHVNLPIILITAHAHDEFGSDDIKEFSAFASGMRPRYMFEKPISPQKLVTAVCEILDVTPASAEQETASSGVFEKMAIKQLIDQTDAETLKKIREMLGGSDG